MIHIHQPTCSQFSGYIPLLGDRNSQSCQEFDATYKIVESWVKKVRTVATILIILLTMPVSYAMLEVATRKIRVKNRTK